MNGGNHYSPLHRTVTHGLSAVFTMNCVVTQKMAMEAVSGCVCNQCYGG
jgi:hypothetical protein